MHEEGRVAAASAGSRFSFERKPPRKPLGRARTLSAQEATPSRRGSESFMLESMFGRLMVRSRSMQVDSRDPLLLISALFSQIALETPGQGIPGCAV